MVADTFQPWLPSLGQAPHAWTLLGALADQQVGGSIAWGIGEIPTVVLMLMVMVDWMRRDARESARSDRQAARDDDAELTAYNARLQALADRSPVPVRLDAGGEQRLPAPVESAAYFVVSEALANVVKYAHASQADVMAVIADFPAYRRMFAAQVIASARELHLDADRLNVHGGAIALGHPFGSTGARIMTTLLNAMQRRDVEFGLETMCVGGGQGMAVVLQRLA